MAPESYTPLESLLLFQSLQPSDENSPSFSQISDVLKTSELLRDCGSFAQGRFEPDSLKEHYLQLIREEVRAERERDQDPQINGSSPRKRKRSIPLLENDDEASQYKYLLPQVTNRLYFKYRDHAIKSIEEEERRYRCLQREIQEIERGEWDSRLGYDSASRRTPRGVSSIQTILRHDGEGQESRGSVQPTPGPSNAVSNGVGAGARPHEQSPGASGVKQPPYPRGLQNSPSDHQKFNIPGSAESNAPLLPPPPPLTHGHANGSPSSEVSRRLPPPNSLPPHPLHPPSPRSARNPLPHPERSSASPIILPPPPGMIRSSGSPTGPLDTLADMAGQQYRANPSMQSSRSMQHPASQAHQLPQPRNYAPRSYNYYDNQPPYQAPYPPYTSAPLPPVHYPQQQSAHPYQAAAAIPGHGPPYTGMPPYQSPVAHYPPPHPGYHPSHGYYQQPPAQSPYARGRIPPVSNQHTPISTASKDHRQAVKPSPIVTSTSSTKWKKIDPPGSVRQPSPKSPSPGAVSPISEKAPSPLLENAQPNTGDARVQKSHHRSTDSPGTNVQGRGIRSRGGGRRGRKGRAVSAASSTRAESSAIRTRSQSIVSQADELSIDQPVSTRKIKPEPAASSSHDDNVSVASQTADEGGRKLTRRRRGTNRSLENVEAERPSSKRKREKSSGLPRLSPMPSVSSRPGHVLATRNFPRIAAPLMNDISTHKLGNLFAKPLTDREAPGYKDLIYRSQDLRSIKNAISTGGKAVAKAVESMGEEANSTSVWIPETPDVIPPTGIVNSMQLEKELMRIFANAIMFNPEVPSKRGIGPAFRTRQRTIQQKTLNEVEKGQSEEEIINGKQDVSVVKDTREIFEAVEEMVAQWRSAEKTADKGSVPPKGPVGQLRGGGSEEADELAGNGEEVVGTVEREPTPEPRAKRRRR